MSKTFEAVPLDQKLKEIGRDLEAARIKKGLSKKQMVKEGIRKASIIAIETGTTDFSFSTLLNICNQLGVNVKITFE